MAVSSSYLADALRATGKLSTTAARKIFTTFGKSLKNKLYISGENNFNIPMFLAVGTPGLMMILQYFFGYDKIWSVTIFTIALTLNGAVTAGYLGNGLDIAPNFSGTIFGLANTLSSFGGFLSTYIVGVLTFENVSFF